MSDFVEVVSRTTGERQTVPAHFLENPILGRDFEPYVPETPEQVALRTQQIAELASRTIPQLEGYAAANGVDLTGLTRKADIVDAVAAHLAAPTIPSPDQASEAEESAEANPAQNTEE
jgi:hypothetical protein